MEPPFSQLLIRLVISYSVNFTRGIYSFSNIKCSILLKSMSPFIGQASNVSKKKKTALFFVPLVPGFSTASYLKVHIKTHHGSPLPTIHTFPEPRGELQVHNGNPFHMGRQCLVEGKRPLVPFQTFMFWAFHLLCCF